MSRRIPRLHQFGPLALPVALLLILVVALLPARLLPWTADVSDLVLVPVRPLAHAGTLVGQAVRTVRADAGGAEDPAVSIPFLEEERDRYRRLYEAERLRSGTLAASLQALQGLPDRGATAAPPLLLKLDVVGRDPRDGLSTASLKLGPASRARVQAGDAAVFAHEHVVGRGVRVSEFSATVLPLAHEESGPVRGTLAPRNDRGDDRGDDRSRTTHVQLMPTGDGDFRAEIDLRTDVQLGDVVMLDDDRWPGWSKALVIGAVVEVEPIDDAPLLQQLTVRPAYQLARLPHVVVLSAQEDVRLGGVEP